MPNVETKNITSNCVLLGRGGATNNHLGNKRFRTLVSEHQPQYLLAKKKDKSTIARSIVDIIRARGGSFLKKVEGTDNQWTDVGDKKATEKTSQALREGLDVRHQGVNATTKIGLPTKQSAGTSSVEQPKKRRKKAKGGDSSDGDSSPTPEGKTPKVETPAALKKRQISKSDCDNIAAV